MKASLETVALMEMWTSLRFASYKSMLQYTKQVNTITHNHSNPGILVNSTEKTQMLLPNGSVTMVTFKNGQV